MFFYLLFPFIVFLLRKLNTTTISIIIISIWILSAVQHYYFVNNLYEVNNIKIEQFILYFPLWNLNIFLFGLLCGIYIKKIKINNLLFSRLLYITGIIAFFAIFLISNPIIRYVHNGLLAPLFL